MSRDQDVISVAMEIGRSIIVAAKGNPAQTVAYAFVAGGAIAATAITYGAYKYGGQLIEWVSGSDEND